MNEPITQSIPLSQLELSPGNVRKTSAGKTAFAELKASIAAHGLLGNLIAHAIEPGHGGDVRYAVIAGGRRLTALIDLAREGMLSTDYPVPCRVVGDDAPESELSLVENVVRAAMHPADQVEAFAGLADGGATVADIAARFGVAERLVEQRLRLGNAAPVLLDAYREGGIDLEVLTAFAVTADRERQIAVWEQVKEQGYRPGAWQIKRMLTEDRVAARTAIARFVGVEAYEAADGAVTRDLFADEDDNGVWLDDPELLNKLATAKLESAANDLRPEWKWAEARIDMDWNTIARFGRIVSTPATPKEEERAELERLEAREDELTNLDDEEWTEALVEEADAIEARNDELKASLESRAEFLEADRAISGCIATIREDGELRLIKGLVRPEDMPQRKSAVDGTEADDGEGEYGALEAPGISGPAASPVDPRAEARKEAGVGIGLADDLRAIRTTLVKAHLARDFEAAFDLLLFQMGRAVFTGGYQADALDITIRETPDRPMLAHERRCLSATEPRRGPVGRPFGSCVRLDGEARRRRRLHRAQGVARGGQAGAVRGLRGKNPQGPTRLRARRPARVRSHRRPARHRLRHPGPAHRGVVLVAHYQGPHARGRPCHPGRGLGAGSRQAQEDGTVYSNGGRLRGRRCRGGRCPRRKRASLRDSGSCPGSRPTTTAASTMMTVTRKAALRAMAGRPKAPWKTSRPQRRRRTEASRKTTITAWTAGPGPGVRFLPADTADDAGTAGAVPDTGGDADPETPTRTMNACVHAIVESLDSPAVAETRAAALGALNAVPTSDGGPRVIVATADFGDDASVDDGSGDPHAGGCAADASGPGQRP